MTSFESFRNAITSTSDAVTSIELATSTGNKLATSTGKSRKSWVKDSQHNCSWCPKGTRKFRTESGAAFVAHLMLEHPERWADSSGRPWFEAYSSWVRDA